MMRTSPTDQRRLRPHRFLRRRLAALVIRTAFATGAVLIALAAAPDSAFAQERRILSPPGHSAVQVGGNFDPVQYGYLGGAWIDVYYGRPLKRGRDLFGPPDWAEMLNDGAPVWRAGANRSTRLVTETALLIAGTRVEPGEYTLFIDLSDTVWTFIVSTWPAQETYDYENREALFGAFEYTDDRDVLRTPMALETLPVAFDQLSWQFLDMTASGGRLALIWDTRMASVAFTVAD
ncbi:MAG: DUF2911 domain-containing protein [Acidobacteria bacterium]|nr:DUF2911 domain-containing protein [Acidobacteriota bacterium]MYK88056.1 DUF2911 domain-containing protein [Acidobacteriota bacterium]